MLVPYLFFSSLSSFVFCLLLLLEKNKLVGSLTKHLQKAYLSYFFREYSSCRNLLLSISLHRIRSEFFGMDYNDTIPGNDLSLYVSLSALSAMAVVLRLIARIKTKTTLRGDDWLACLGLILLQAFLGLSIWGNFRVPVAH